jgi:hypothetical protein
MEYFSTDYSESRTKFRTAVTDARGRLTTLAHPTAKGPGGENLSVDVGVFGRSPTPKVFFNLNGVHGNESYSGGAAQLQWIASGAPGRLPDDVCAVLIHNLNPFGWAWDSPHRGLLRPHAPRPPLLVGARHIIIKLSRCLIL